MDNASSPDPAGKSRILSHVAELVSGGILAQFLLFARALLLPKCLTTIEYGQWQGMLLTLDVASHSHLGILYTLNRELGLVRGDGTDRSTEQLRANAFWASLFLAFLAGAILVLASITPIGDTHGVRIALWICAGVILVKQVYFYHTMVLRATGAFPSLARRDVLNAAAFLVFCVPLAWYAGVWGASAGLLISFILSISFLGTLSPVPSFQLDWKIVKGLISRGFCFFLLPFSYLLLGKAEQFVALPGLGSAAVAQLAIAHLVVSPIFMVPVQIGRVLYTAYLHKFELTKDSRQVGEVSRVPLRFAAWFCSLLAVIGALFVDIPIKLFLAEYIPAIQLSYIIFVGAVPMCLHNVVSNLYLAIGMQKLVLKYQLATIAAIVLGCSIALRVGSGLWGLLVVSTSCTVVYSLAIVGKALAITDPKSKVVVELLKLILPLGWAATPFVVAAVWKGVVEIPQVLSSGWVRAASLLFLGGPLAYGVWKQFQAMKRLSMP